MYPFSLKRIIRQEKVPGFGHNKFVKRGPTLSGVGGYRRHHLSHEHSHEEYSANKSQHC